MRNHFLTLVLIGCLCLTSQFAFAQISEGGTPISFSLDIDMRRGGMSTLEMPMVNNQALLIEDEIAKIENDPNPLFRFGYTINVDIDLKAAGIKKELSCGGNLWLLKIHSDGAYSINLIFDRFYLAEGSRFFIFNEDRTMVLGAFTPEVSNSLYSLFATELIQGSTIVLEYYEPAGSNGSIINISQVIHAYINTFSPGFGLSASCNIDVMCTLGNNWRNQQRSVCLIIMGNYSASGALVNNTRQDLTPYILTARHNFFDSNNHGNTPNRNPATAVFRFLYWRPNCNSGNPINYRSVTGATLRATYRSTDMALLELNTKPPLSWNLYYAGWDRTTTPAQNATAIHHPRGDAMKIAHDRNSVRAVTWPGNSQPTGALTHWRATFNNGIVQHGSSGSPLFNQNRRIVGQLHGNINNQCWGWDNNCFCRQTPVGEYGRFDLSWTGGGTNSTRLSSWLDPLETNYMTFNGRRAPYISGPNIVTTGTICETTFTLANIPQEAIDYNWWSSSSALQLMSPANLPTAKFRANPNVSGSQQATINFSFEHNDTQHTISRSVTTRAMPNIIGVFTLPGHHTTITPLACRPYYFGAHAYLGTPFYIWRLYAPLSDFGPIGPTMYSGQFTYNFPVTFFDVGLHALTLSVQDACGANVVSPPHSFWVQENWSPWDCPPSISFTYYPNPANDMLTIEFGDPDPEHLQSRGTLDKYSFDIKLFNHDGRKVRHTSWDTERSSRKIHIDLRNLPEGTYFLHVEGNGQVQKKQIIIQRN